MRTFTKASTYLDECINKRLLPFIERYHHDGNYIVWPDLPNAHYSTSVQQRWEEKNVPFVRREDNPPNVPQVRPIIAIWTLPERKVYENNWEARNLDALIQRIKQKAKELDQKMVQVMNNNLKNNIYRILFIIFLIIWLFFSLWSLGKLVLSLKQTSITKSSSKNFSYLNPSWVRQLEEKDLKIYSQNGEDGVILWIFSNIGTVNHPPRFVEFGTENGEQCNTHLLRTHLGWQGLMMDGGHDIPKINLHKETITPKNINDLLEKYETPSLLDLLSIDVDFDDYFIWKSILQANRFHARVVIIEYNYAIPPNENRVVDPYQDSRRWIGTMHFGAGILAVAALGRAHNYTLIYAEKKSVNLFFIQTSILITQGILHLVPTLEQIYASKPIPNWKHSPELDKTRRWIWNDTIWK